ncbi:MAG: hypothetical protein PUH73_00105 [Clostridium sp.]|nr:hypothetical protein [Clostridium sp.]
MRRISFHCAAQYAAAFTARDPPLFLFFLERKGSKRKSSAEQLLFAAVAFFANMLHKTDGSYGNHPFFRSEQDMRETSFSPKENLPPQCLLFLFFKKRNRSPFLFFLKGKGSKRKSSAEQLLFAAVAFFANVLHKTDGSYGNRPFFRSEQDMRETAFSPKENLPRSVFCFFSSRKEIVLP